MKPTLVIHSVWEPRPGDQDPPVAYAVDPARRRVALRTLPLLLAVELALLVLSPPFLAWYAIACAALAVVVLTRSTTGSSGFYELRPDGSLGAYLGHQMPEGAKGRTRRRASVRS